MFWRFGGYANISSIDNILDRADVTLEELLDENDVIQELKAQNAKLIEFLRDDAALAKLLKYVLAPKVAGSSEHAHAVEPERSRTTLFGGSRSKPRSKSSGSSDEDVEQQEAKRSKYAHVASEILSSEVWSISESLLENSDLLHDFWEYIKNDSPLDNRTAGYFAKVNEALLEKKPVEMIAFIKVVDNVVVNLMKHVDCPVIMDLLLKLISLEKEPTTQGIVDWLQSQNLIPIFLSYITPEHPASTQTAAGDFLKAIITISANATGQDASVIGPNELTRQLVSEACVDKLLEEMLRGGNPLTVGVGIVIEVIRKNNSDYDSENQVSAEPKSSDPIYLGMLLRKFAENVPKFMELILSRNHTVVTEKGSESVERKQLDVAWGRKIEPLGFDRFKTCELMAELLHCSNMRLLNEAGSESEMKRRDIERERLKKAGKLAAERSHLPGSEFGTSVDSSGFHIADTLAEDFRTLEIQNNTDDDEEFEKVAVSEAIPDMPGSGGNTSPAKDVEDIELDNDTVITGAERSVGDADSRAKPLSKRRISLLTQQIEATHIGHDEPALISHADTESGSADENINDKPKPLFSNRSAEQSAVSSATSPQEAESNPPQDAPGADKSLIPASSSTDDGQEQLQPDIQLEEDGTPVVGDLLKVMFVEHHVVPTILDFFFRFPWNNFLHNVVYDVIQQVFNGSMDRGFNRNLAIDLFETGRVTNQVIEGQQRSDKSQEECKRRLGYMGHLTLIAEEIVKFTERQSAYLLAQSVVDKVTDPDWMNYVEQTLSETRERDNAILGGVRPDHSIGPRQTVLNTINASQLGFTGTESSALANAGLSGNIGGGLDSLDLASAGAAGYGLNSSSGLMSRFGGSDDEEDEDLEEGELGGDSTDEFRNRQMIDDDDTFSKPTSIAPQHPSSEPPPIPAPLAVAPTRARRQLEQRLAEKKRLAESGSDSFANEAEDTPSTEMSKLALDESGQSDSFEAAADRGTSAEASKTSKAAHAGGATSVGTAKFFPQSDTSSDDGFPDVESSEEGEDEEGASGPGAFADDFTGGAVGDESPETGTGTEGEGEAEEGSDDDDDEDSADEASNANLRRQTTREAVQRRPIDVDDDSDEEEEAVALPPPLQQPPRRMSVEAAAEAKKREQERLLRRWGFDDEDTGAGPSSTAAKPNTDTDTDEDDDDDDEPVLMGSKYTARRRTGS